MSLPVLPRLRTALGLPSVEWARAAEAAALFHGFRLALRVVPFRRFQGLLGTPGPRDARPEAPPAPAPGALAVARAIHRAAKAHPDTCLAQALAGRVMLRRRGLPSTVSLGARRGDGDFAFHAWLRSGGVLLTAGGGPDHFTVLSTFYDPPC